MVDSDDSNAQTKLVSPYPFLWLISRQWHFDRSNIPLHKEQLLCSKFVANTFQSTASVSGDYPRFCPACQTDY